MLKGYAVVFKHLKHLPAKAKLGVHHVLFNGYGGKASMTGYTCNCEFAVVAARLLDNHSARVVRLVCIFNINRYARFSNREDRLFMKHTRSHIGKLPQLMVGDCLNRLRVRDYPWVADQKS